MKAQAAVLTGDLIGSTEAPPEAVETGMRLLARLATQIGTTTFFTRYRGDGWQIYLEDPGAGLSSTLFIWASLRAAGGLESRIALGLGKAVGMQTNALATFQQQDYPQIQRNALAGHAPPGLLPSSKQNALAPHSQGEAVTPQLNVLATVGLSGVMGEAFTASGRALDHMNRPQRLALAGQAVDPLHRRLFALIEERITSWSVEQAEAMALVFTPDTELTQAAMAERLGISRQAVAARLQAGGYTQLVGAAEDFALTFGSGTTE